MADHHNRQTARGQWSRPDIGAFTNEALQRGAQVIAKQAVDELDEADPDLEGVEQQLFEAAALLRLLWDRSAEREAKRGD